MRGVLNLPNGMGAKGAKITVYDSNNLMKALANEIKKKGGAGASPPQRYPDLDGQTDGRTDAGAWSRGRVIARARARTHTQIRTHALSLSHTHAHTRARARMRHRP